MFITKKNENIEKETRKKTPEKRIKTARFLMVNKAYVGSNRNGNF